MTARLSLVCLWVSIARTAAADTADTGLPPPPPLGSSDIGIGIHTRMKWIQQFGTDKHDEAFVVAPSELGTFVGGITLGDWFRPLTDVCAPTEDIVPDDCGDAVVFNALTGVGIQQGDTLSDSVRGLVVENGFVTFGGRSRDVTNLQEGAFMTRYSDDLLTEQWQYFLHHAEFLGIDTHGDDTYGVGGSLFHHEPGEDRVGKEDALMISMDAFGITENIQQTGTTGFDELHDVQIDDAGVYISGGSKGYLGEVGGLDPGDEDAMLFVEGFTLDEAEEQCRLQFGSDGRDMGEGIAISGKFLYVVGNAEGIINGTLPDPPACFHENDNELPDAYLAKFDKKCNPIWTREWGTVDGDAAEAVAVDDQFVYVVGYAGSGLDHVDEDRHETTDGFLRVYNFRGKVVGEVLFDGSLSPADADLRADYARGVAVDDNFVYVVGATQGSLGKEANLGDFDLFLATIPKADVTNNITFEGKGCGQP